MEEKTVERPLTEKHKWIVPAVALLIITAHLALLISSARHKSHTSDEPFHLARGVAAIITGDFRTSVAHPPLVNMICALPLTMAYDFSIPTSHPVWTSRKFEPPSRKIALARHFLYGNPHYLDIVSRGRVPVMILSALLAVILGVWAGRLFGAPAGLMAMALYCFSPTMLAHARLSTTDTGCAFFTLLFAASFCRYLRSPKPHSLFLAGVTLGLAQLSKYTCIILVPLVPLVLIIERERLLKNKEDLSENGERPLYPGWILSSLVIFLIGFLVLWAGYGFEMEGFHELTMTGNMASVSRPGLLLKQAVVKGLAFVNPPPETYFYGLSQTLLETAAHPKPLFFLGQVSQEGWWYYYPVLFLMKEPVALLLLIAAGLLTLKREPAFQRPEKTVALAVSLSFLFAFMFLNQKNIGIRHLLPIYPFLFLWLARLARVRLRRGFFPAAAWILVAAIALRAFIIHPDYLVHFNHLVGGPRGGLKLSVVGEDWGQDVAALGKFCRKKDIQKIYYKHYGTADPEAYGVPYAKYRCNMKEPGWYAFHVVDLRRGGHKRREECYRPFMNREPEAILHHTIYVYKLEKYKSGG
ncbi:MAG: glycosyltransferase family 39 protein [bacterium]